MREGHEGLHEQHASASVGEKLDSEDASLPLSTDARKSKRNCQMLQ
jgi:hypothetical protein